MASNRDRLLVYCRAPYHYTLTPDSLRVRVQECNRTGCLSGLTGCAYADAVALSCGNGNGQDENETDGFKRTLQSEITAEYVHVRRHSSVLDAPSQQPNVQLLPGWSRVVCPSGIVAASRKGRRFIYISYTKAGFLSEERHKRNRHYTGKM